MLWRGPTKCGITTWTPDSTLFCRDVYFSSERSTAVLDCIFRMECRFAPRHGRMALWNRWSNQRRIVSLALVRHPSNNVNAILSKLRTVDADLVEYYSAETFVSFERQELADLVGWFKCLYLVAKLVPEISKCIRLQRGKAL